MQKPTPEQDKEIKRIKEMIRAGTQVLLFEEVQPAIYNEEELEQVNKDSPVQSHNRCCPPGSLQDEKMIERNRTLM